MSTRPDPVVAGWSGLGTFPTMPRAGYQEVPEAETAAMGLLTDQVLRRLWGVRDPQNPDAWLVKPLSPWRRFVTASLLPEDLTRYKEGRSGFPTGTDPYTTIGGPSAQVAAFDLRSDHAAVTAPADITWSGTATVAPVETIALSTISDEKLGDAFTIDSLDSAAVPVLGRSPIDPAIAHELTDALNRRSNDSFIGSVGSAADPRHGVTSYAGITSQAAGTTPYIDDAFTAVFNLRVLRRTPNVVFIPPSLAKIWRQAKGSTGGSYLFDPSQPMSIDGVPVVSIDGIAAGAATFFLVGDFSWVQAQWRLMANGRLAMVAKSSLGANFSTDQTTFRIAERWDANLTPGYGPSIVKVTGINAP